MIGSLVGPVVGLNKRIKEGQICVGLWDGREMNLKRSIKRGFPVRRNLRWVFAIEIKVLGRGRSHYKIYDFLFHRWSLEKDECFKRMLDALDAKDWADICKISEKFDLAIDLLKEKSNAGLP